MQRSLEWFLRRGLREIGKVSCPADKALIGSFLRVASDKVSDYDRLRERMCDADRARTEVRLKKAVGEYSDSRRRIVRRATRQAVATFNKVRDEMMADPVWQRELGGVLPRIKVGRLR